jgi:hypothetical protein
VYTDGKRGPMRTILDAAGSKELIQSGANEESTGKLVCWLSIFAFGAGSVSLGLLYDIRSKSSHAWFDLPILLTCLIFARNCALHLLKKS